ncbi:mechanosensitive ion channel family protein [Desulfogranum mediterraneum]|uniref:mechanosensitive ion channel family protein n=1 Tax=Desulfogranum mediterraneum TaxID=160661 RepID=UPI0003F5E05C|nr:mechanosensitive ion channel domain-containing protein [Desulfogranum mediterraneum]
MIRQTIEQLRYSLAAAVLAALTALPSSLALAAEKVTGAAAPETAAAPEEAPAKKLIDLSNPQDALDPDKYLELLQLAKEWLLTHGPNIILAVAILIIGRWLAMWLASLGKKAMVRGNVDVTLARFLAKLIYYAMLAAVLIAAADQMGIKTTSFVAIFGAASLAIGLALKDSLSNFASGIMLILFRPFKVNDFVTAGGVSGKVEQVDIFSTIILTPDNQQFIVPNSSITANVITNVNAEPTRRIDLTIGIGYDDDLRLAKELLQELVRAEPRVLSEPAPMIAVTELAESSVNLVVRPWVQTADYWSVRLELTEKIKLCFDDNNISFPFPQQDVHLHRAPAS